MLIFLKIMTYLSIKLLQDAKDKHLPVQKIKFNKYQHKKNKWITRGVLKSIKTRNKLYKVLQQTDTEDVESFESIKIRFNRFHIILRQSIKEANQDESNHYILLTCGIC